jgi:hypothetical protein
MAGSDDGRHDFRGTPWDREAKIEALAAVVASGTVLDFGCAWGYGVRQLVDAGFDAVGFEIARGRAEYGCRKLGVEIFSDIPALQRRLGGRTLDAVFSHHVLEHLGVYLKDTLELFASLLRPRGVGFHVLPNFAGRAAREGAFLSWIGEAHPLAPTTPFFRASLPAYGFGEMAIGTGPFDGELVRLLREERWSELDRDGDELLVVSWRN